MASRSVFRPAATPVALAALSALSHGAHAEDAAASLPAVTITAAPAKADVAGFGDLPLVKLPLQARTLDQAELRDRGVQRLADITSIDASVSDAYDAGGYWDMLAIRGFTLDNRRNFRRDGLPINAETLLPLDNKERVEILKGTTGMQAGLSAPGGLVNLVVKRPEANVRSATLGWRSHNSRLAAVDLGNRFGPDNVFGLRLNVAYEKLDPPLRSAKGERALFALAGDWQLTPDTLLEAEIESSRSSQPTQPGFSLLGDTLPAASSVDPRTNLNNQPWSQPTVMRGQTGSLRLQRRLAAGWKFTAHAASQQLKSDDRLAYPFGVFDPATYECSYCDRYAPDGTYSMWQFVSDGERRRTDAIDLSVQGQAQAFGLQHDVTVGVLHSRYKARFRQQVYDLAGTGNIDGTLVTPPSAGFTDENTNRTERTDELYLRSRTAFGQGTAMWLGLRHSRLDIESVRTDGSRPIGYDQSFTTPWLSLSHEWARNHTVYASWGQGVESAVTPNRSGYGAEAGQPLPALRSRQFEIGYKGRPTEHLQVRTAYFDIRQPYVNDTGSSFSIDGRQQRRGIELEGSWENPTWRIDASSMLLDAQLRDSSTGLEGKRPVNVPERTFKAQVAYRVPALPRLQLTAGLVHEGDREVLPDNSITIPAWTRLDLGLRLQQRLEGTTLTWRAGVYNATDKRAWRESPYQYGHVYLYPLAPRTWSGSVQIDF
jgi:iron complex outermembrane receptor protein